MSTELNNHENQEQEDPRLEWRNKRTYLYWAKAGAAVAVAGAAGKANADELLLCTYWHPEIGVETIVNNPGSDDDQVSFQDLTNPLVLSPGVSQKVYKNYILKGMTEYIDGGTTDWRIFKKINGQDVQVGILDGMGGQPIGLMTDSGVFFSGGKFYKVTDTGSTLSSQEIGELPLPGMAGMANIGGYIFANYKDGGKEMLAAFNEQEVLNHDPGSGLVPIASLKDITPPKITSQWSLGMDVDASTGELIIPQKQGVTPIDFTAFLDEDGQLPPDFSLTDIDVGTFKDLGVSTVGTLASNGYRYHGMAGGAGIIMQTPTGQTVTIGKEQLNGGTGVQLSTMYELVHGGIYIIFNNNPDSLTPVPPVVLHESGEITVDPGDMTPFIKKCFVLNEENQEMFAPVADSCEGVTCEQPANECAEAACDPGTGDCEETAKPDDTPCVGPTNLCATYHICKDGACVGGPTEMTCGDNNECTKDSCIPATGCSNIPTPGLPCNDGDYDTTDDKCTDEGGCQGAPIVNPEPNPEPEPDVVEQGEEIIEGELVEEVEPGEDVVEAFPEQPDVAEQEDTNDTDSSGDTIDATPDSSDDALYVEGEGEDTPTEAETNAEEISADIYADTQEVIAAEKDHPKKSPGCGCTTTGISPDSMSGTLLLGAMLIGLAANMRYKILSALMKRR